MKKYIYKIENLINHKIYIGQTNNPKRRFQEHKKLGYSKENNKVLYYAFQKYGLENFSFEIIEEVENYNEREIYWINYYDSFENGYNMTLGGDEPPVFHGEEHHLTTHSFETVNMVKKLLKETKMSTKEISKITNYNISSINRINDGTLWKDEKEDYPLRKETTKKFLLERANNIKYDLINTKISQRELAEKYGVGRTTITAINNGQNYRDKNLTYPLRK